MQGQQKVTRNIVKGNLNIIQKSNDEIINILIEKNYILLKRLMIVEEKNKILISKMRYLKYLTKGELK